MRARLPALVAAVLLLGPGVLACLNGGYFDRPRLWAAIGAWALLAVVAIALPRPLPASTSGRLALGGLAALTAWTALSLNWAPDGSRAGDDLQRLLLYLPYLAAAIAVLEPRLTEPLLLAAITGACAYGLSERFLPGLVDLATVGAAGDRLAYPLSYWNGTGAFAAVGLILAAALAADQARSPQLRAAAAAAGPPLALTLLLTFSRGALGALAAGVLVLIALAPTRGQLAAAIVAVGGGALAAAVLMIAFGGLRRAGGATGASGVVALAGLLAAMAACAFAGYTLARGRDAPIAWLRNAALAAAAVALVGTVAAVVGTERVTGTDTPESGPQRLASVQSNRYAYWKAAARAFADHPLRGEGSGSFRAIWLRERPFRESVRDAHSLYLETAAELGLVGLLALGCLIAGCVLAGIRAGPPAAGAIAALVAFALHAGIDWDWELPAFVLVALALAGRLIAAAEPPIRAAAAVPDAPAP
jgi:O-Antigen ligase